MRTAPRRWFLEPANDFLTAQTQIAVSGTVSDQSPTTITVNNNNAPVQGGSFTANVSLVEGDNNLLITALDAAGNRTDISRHVVRDTTAPNLSVAQPLEGATVMQSAITVSGTVSDVNGTVVSINDDPKLTIKIVGNQFTATALLTEGPNTLTIRAFDRVGNHTDIVRTVNYSIDHTPPVLTVSEPVSGAVTRILAVSGTVSSVNPPAAVTVNGHPAALLSDGQFAGGVDLSEGPHDVVIEATDTNGNRTTIIRSITIDTTVPTITQISPADGSIVDAAEMAIQGQFTDASAVAVKVNGQAATISNGAFTSTISTGEGDNQVSIAATDAAGNTTNTSLTLIGRDRTPPAVPDVFAVTSPTRLTFQTIEGRAEPGAQVRISGGLELTTSDAAFGSGLFTSTVRLAPGINTLSITAKDAAGNVSPPVSLSVTSDPSMSLPPNGQPAQINISFGDAQRGLVGVELPRPLIAIVTDKSGAPVSGVTVHFQVIQGGGHLVNGNSSSDVQTDAQGKASARYVCGADPGVHIIRANFNGNTSTPAAFAEESLPAMTGSTIVSGVVEDQNLRALPNVLVRIGGQQTRTGTDGRFTVSNVPSGPHQLLELIGRDQVSLPGRWPNISYDFDVLPGVDNNLGRPLFLPLVNDGISLPLDAANVVTSDTTFELPVVSGQPPIRVTARAGTHILFPPDVTDKRLSVTQIPTNRTPMVLEDGRATNLYISVQPSGAIFERPLDISFPNLDGQPANAPVLLMSFDHDAGRYIQVGTGHVSADGRTVTSDEGSGIRVGAWHALPPPAPQPEVTVLGHIQFKDNPAFQDQFVRVSETWVEGVQAVLTTSGPDIHKAPRWDFRATYSIPPGTSRLARMESSVVTTTESVVLEPLTAPAPVNAPLTPAVTTPGSASGHIYIAVGQSVQQDAYAAESPKSTDVSNWQLKSADTSVATIDFLPGFNTQSYPISTIIKGVSPGETKVTISYDKNCWLCWFGRETAKEIRVTVVGATSLEASLASTRDVTGSGARPDGAFTTTNKDLSYVPTDRNDLMVVMQNAGPLKIKVVGLNPASAVSSIRWQVERNPDDTVDNGLPDYEDNENGQLTLGPNMAGNYRVICYVNTYNDGTRSENSELRVLRLVVVKLTVDAVNSSIETGVSFTSTIENRNNGTIIFMRLDANDAMNITAKVLVEGGGHDRMLGVDKVHLGFVGNAIGDDFTANYDVPSPTPAPPGNVAGVGRELSGTNFPIVDCSTDNPAKATESVRYHNDSTTAGSGTNGGQIVVVAADDAPGFAVNLRHPTTSNPWSRLSGGNAFRENLIGYTDSFSNNFVTVAKGDWTVITNSTNVRGTWTSAGARVSLQGGNNPKAPLTILSQQPADAAGVQTFGPSFKFRLRAVGGGLVYSP